MFNICFYFSTHLSNYVYMYSLIGWLVSWFGIKAYCLHEEPEPEGAMLSMGDLPKESYPVFMRFSEKTTVNFERQSRQAGPSIEPGISRLTI